MDSHQTVKNHEGHNGWVARRLRFYSKCMGTHWEILHRKGHELIYNFSPNPGCAAGSDCGKGKNRSRVIVTTLQQ